MNKKDHYDSRLSMALDDLSMCQRYCQMMLKLPPGRGFSEERTVYEALLIAFIISYGRVFCSSKTINGEFDTEISNKFGKFRSDMLEKLEWKMFFLHRRIMEKRHTAVAHSDAISRNYQYYKDTVIAIGRIPYYPYDHKEVQECLELVCLLSNVISDERRSSCRERSLDVLFFGQ